MLLAFSLLFTITTLCLGDNVTYTWDFGDGIIENTTERWILHTYTSRGPSNVSLVAENMLSRKSNASSVIVEVGRSSLSILNPSLLTSLAELKHCFAISFFAFHLI